MKQWLEKRSSGVVMPIFSLPSPYGIGTLGESARDFVDFLAKAGQTYWQILPVGHTSCNCPYQCYSSIAGNPMFIDLDNLVELGLLTKEDLDSSDLDLTYGNIDYDRLERTKYDLLTTAYYAVDARTMDEEEEFKNSNEDWLENYATFMAFKKHFNQNPLWEWDSVAKKRDPDTMEIYRTCLTDDVEFYMFLQFLFFKQWKQLKLYANEKGIKLIGDVPMYPSADSCDVWVNPELFMVDENFLPTGVAGVPPDIYSETGQRWGNPTYDWSAHKSQNYSWWISRIKHTMDIVDVLRIDHFRAFQNYWEIPAEEETAVNGKWLPGPGIDFFDAVESALGDIPILAEDLGIIDDSVRKLLEKTGCPGMGVMIFGLRAYEENDHMPHNWGTNRVGYTSTHDSETFVQTVENLSEEDRKFALEYVNANPSEPLGISAVRTAFSSSAKIAILMMADLLSLSDEGRINVPGTIDGNWRWRTKPEDFSEELAEELCRLTKTYKRNR